MQYKIITISRELGSGGRIIGKKVADQLGYHFYDREIIDQTEKFPAFPRSRYSIPKKKSQIVFCTMLQWEQVTD